jgi:hypothetical protein
VENLLFTFSEIGTLTMNETANQLLIRKFFSLAKGSFDEVRNTFQIALLSEDSHTPKPSDEVSGIN